ncbi:MAG: tetratricopeptide repeat protein [Bacteroidales bacterium]|jgi:tetratricopeptide (TPR) repeat protein|nr:tetratricopeptide repeat protein [Bacteroidales bacterium]MCI1784882.1 tetratricopeptide repeat protein [Bacteroidales bacterium]
MNDFIDLKKLSFDELTGVVNLYPWFGAARKELSERMSGLGGRDWGVAQYADSAMYVVSRDIICDLARPAVKEDYSDRDVKDLLETYIDSDKKEGPVRESSEGTARRIRVVGGDYFTQSQYDNVRTAGDNMFSHFADKVKSESSGCQENELSDDFCTETLARIYEEQGYYDEAKRIYSKLILAYPEKNAYFASLIEKLDIG